MRINGPGLTAASFSVTSVVPSSNATAARVVLDGFSDAPALASLEPEVLLPLAEALVPDLSTLDSPLDVPDAFARDVTAVRTQLLDHPRLPQAARGERLARFFAAYAERFVELSHADTLARELDRHFAGLQLLSFVQQQGIVDWHPQANERDGLDAADQLIRAGDPARFRELKAVLLPGEEPEPETLARQTRLARQPPVRWAALVRKARPRARYEPVLGRLAFSTCAVLLLVTVLLSNCS